MKPQTGPVTRIEFVPNRPDVCGVSFTPPNTYGAYCLFSIAPEEGAVTIDGAPCSSAGELVAWIMTRDSQVTVHPCPERYGISLKTEFRTLRLP